MDTFNLKHRKCNLVTEDATPILHTLVVCTTPGLYFMYTDCMSWGTTTKAAHSMRAVFEYTGSSLTQQGNAMVQSLGLAGDATVTYVISGTDTLKVQLTGIAAETVNWCFKMKGVLKPTE